jgi:hypothetical protein
MSSCSSPFVLGSGAIITDWTDGQAAVAWVWRALVCKVFKVAKLGRDVGRSASSAESAWHSRELIPTVSASRSTRHVEHFTGSL